MRRWLAAGLGVALGTGMASLTLFLTLLTFGSRVPTSVTWAEPLCAIGLALLVRTERRVSRRVELERAPSWMRVALVVGVLSSAIALVARSRSAPLGSHDAWAMWTYRARGLFCIEGDWSDLQAFLAQTPAPDHPPLLPLTILRIAESIGEWHPIAAQAANWIFFVCCVVVLVAGTTLWRGGIAGVVAGLLLVGTRELVKTGSGQLADGATATYQVGCFALLALIASTGSSPRAPLMLTGLLAGLSAWTKNEGLAFVVIGAAVWSALRCPACIGSRRGRLGCFLLGAAPALAVVVSFKVLVSHENEVLASDRLAAAMGQLTSWHRWWEVGAAYVATGLKFGYGMPPILALAVIVRIVAASPSAPDLDYVGRALLGTGLCFALVLAVVYVLSPFEVHTHASWSLSRLVLQWWPSVLMVAAAYVVGPRYVGPAAADGRR